MNADKKESENLAIAKRYMEAVENKNAATMDSLLADNYKGKVSAGWHTLKGREGAITKNKVHGLKW